CHAHEIGRRQSIAGPNLAGADSKVATESHRANVEPIGILQNAIFQRGQIGNAVGVVQVAQELLLGMFVAGGSVTANAHTQESWTTTLALSLPDGVEDATPDSLQVAITALAVERDGQRILRAHVLAAAALENQPDVHVILAMLVPVKHRTARAQVITGVPPRDAIDRVLPEVSLLSRLHHGIAADFL